LRSCAIVFTLLLVAAPLFLPSSALGQQANLTSSTTKVTYTQVWQSATSTTTANQSRVGRVLDLQPTYRLGLGVSSCLIIRLGGNPFDFGLPVIMDRGDQVTGSFRTNEGSLVVYIIPDKPYQAWNLKAQKSGVCNCACIPTSFSLSQWGSSVSIDWSAPSDGKYWFVLEVFSGKSFMVTGFLDGHFSQTVEIRSYLTESSLLTVTSASTFALPTTATTSTPAFGLTLVLDSTTRLMIIILSLVLVTLIIAYFMIPRKKQ
jgi:hypothetical protein